MSIQARREEEIYMIKNGFLSVAIIVALVFAAAPSHGSESNARRPDFTLPDLDGTDRSISEWDGNAMLINFWATWCIPCVREIPMLSELHNDYRDRDFQVLGIAVDTPENVREFLDRVDMDYLTLVEEQKSQEVAREFSEQFLGLPFSAFVDHEGRVLWVHAGEVHRAQAELVLNHIWDIRAGNKTFDQARSSMKAQLKNLKDSRAER